MTGSAVPIGSKIGCHCVGSKTKKNLESSHCAWLGCRLPSICGIAFREGSEILEGFMIAFADEGRLTGCLCVFCCSSALGFVFWIVLRALRTSAFLESSSLRMFSASVSRSNRSDFALSGEAPFSISCVSGTGPAEGGTPSALFFSSVAQF